MKNIILHTNVLLLLILNACNEPINIDLPDYEPKLVVYGLLETQSDQLPKIFVSESQGYFEYADQQNFGYTPVLNAAVQLNVDGNTYDLILNTEESNPVDTLGFYINYYNGDTMWIIDYNPVSQNEYYTIDEAEYPNFKVENDKKYTINIVAEEKSVNAETNTIGEIAVTNAAFERDTIVENYRDGSFEQSIDIVRLSLQDIPNQKDAYTILYTLKYPEFIHINGDISDTVLHEIKNQSNFYQRISDGNQDGQILEQEIYLYDLPSYYRYEKSENFFQEYTSTDYNLPAVEFEMTYQIIHFDEATIEYFESIDSQRDSNGNPFVEPTFINGNIENGLGLFGAKTISETVHTLKFVCCD